MNSPRKFAEYLLVACAVPMVAACANQREPAKRALDEINTAVGSVSADAKKYVPDQLASVQAKVSDLTASFDMKDYSAVVAGAPAVLAQAQGLTSVVAAKIDEAIKALNDEWAGPATSIPPLVEAVNTRAGELSKTRHIQKGIHLAAARSGLVDATDGWGRAQAAMASGEVDNAIATAKDVKSKIEAAAAALKLQLPVANR